MKRLTSPALLIWCVLAAMTGCRGDSDPVVMVQADDTEMAAAVEQARASISDFTQALASPSPDQSGFAVKMEFKDGERSEFMWLTDVEFSNGTFTGTLNNEPEIVSNATFGEQYSVGSNDINDWIYMDGEELVGGHTIAVLMARQ